ncbi:Retrotrans gag domain-containing protein [Abeliophyllum distichum]|uniref:Retrotrans gag domain-containing protein n=1 Tax=Abeliophyllum distichum TaxID=126358 RepID=A0ABD1QY47_9LAMI
MGIAEATPALKCKAFPLTLEGSAFRLYKKLPSRSIHSWKNLKTAFKNKFVFSQPSQLLVQRLQDLRRGKHESLKSYLARFNCENITEAKMFSALKGGLEMRSMFWRNVRSRNPREYNALLDMMKEKIISEEMARPRDNQTQQHYNQEGQTNIKPPDENMHH